MLDVYENTDAQKKWKIWIFKAKAIKAEKQNVWKNAQII